MFIKTIRKWFVPQTEKGQAEKEKLLRKEGEKRPAQHTDTHKKGIIPRMHIDTLAHGHIHG